MCTETSLLKHSQIRTYLKTADETCVFVDALHYERLGACYDVVHETDCADVNYDGQSRDAAGENCQSRSRASESRRTRS